MLGIRWPWQRRVRPSVTLEIAQRQHDEAELHRRRAMDREKRDLFYGLGFDMSDDAQCWHRHAQLMREHHDRLGALEAKVSEIDQLLMLSATHR